MPNSTPPSGWPTRSAPCWRAWFWAMAAGSCWTGTSRGSAAASASSKNTKNVPSTKATTAMWATVMWSAASATTIVSMAAARTASETSMMRLRFQRSTSAPAGRKASRNGRVWAKATNPAWAGEPGEGQDEQAGRRPT